MLYNCTECLQPKCNHKDLMCKDCAQRTVRTIRIPYRDMMAGDIVIKQFLEPGESVQSSYDDDMTHEHVLIVKKHIN